MVTETDLALGDGRTLHVYETGSGDGTTGLAVFWQHGAPSTGAPPEPLFSAAAERGIRWVSHDRPGYGGSTPDPGRDVASAAADVARAAATGRAALEAYFASAEFDPDVFTRPITPRSSVRGHGWAPWPARLGPPTRAGWWTTTWPTSPLGL